jgi:hypothetical protein
VFTYQCTPPLAPLFRLSGVMSQYILQLLSLRFFISRWLWSLFLTDRNLFYYLDGSS